MRIVKEYLCDVYWIEFGLIKEGFLLLLPFSRALFYAICGAKQRRSI